MIKKALFTIIAVLATYTCAFADAAGNCGDKCYWNYEEATQTLWIKGEGKMWSNNTAPHFGYYTDTNIRNNIKHIIVDDKITEIGGYAFGECRKVEDIQLPNSLEIIDTNAFEYCSSLKSIYIPASVKLYLASSGCSSLTEIIVDPNNKYYDSRYNCNAIIETKTNTLIEGCKTTTIPNGITCIGYGAFRWTPIEEINIPEGVTKIEIMAFECCQKLKSVTLPSTLTEIESRAFNNCLALESIVVKATSAPDCELQQDGTMYVFGSVNKDKCTVYVPQHRDSRTYLSANGWKDFKNIVQVDMDEYEKTAAARKLCDTNQDGTVNSTDIVRIYNFITTGK